MTDLLQDLRLLSDCLRETGRRPVLVGTYALFLQGWLPPTYELLTKDVDVYVEDPLAPFDEDTQA